MTLKLKISHKQNLMQVKSLAKWNKTTKRNCRLKKATKSCSQQKLNISRIQKHRKTQKHFETSVNLIFLTNMPMGYRKLSSLKQKKQQPPEVFCKKRCSQTFRKFHRHAPASEPLFQNTLEHHNRTPFLSEHLWLLLLQKK